MSLNDQIRAAKTPGEVQTLLELGQKTYTSAAWATQEKWRRVAAARIDELLTPAVNPKEAKAVRKALRKQNIPQPA